MVYQTKISWFSGFFGLHPLNQLIISRSQEKNQKVSWFSWFFWNSIFYKFQSAANAIIHVQMFYLNFSRCFQYTNILLWCLTANLRYFLIGTDIYGFHSTTNAMNVIFICTKVLFKCLSLLIRITATIRSRFALCHRDCPRFGFPEYQRGFPRCRFAYCHRDFRFPEWHRVLISFFGTKFRSTHQDACSVIIIMLLLIRLWFFREVIQNIACSVLIIRKLVVDSHCKLQRHKIKIWESAFCL